jgi:pyruvate/2-oxoglutarate dehydrogenase complex dihydrolipoamide dehydrogenase (E3) component
MPNLKGMGLEAVGIDTNAKGGIAVNDKLQMSIKEV